MDVAKEILVPPPVKVLVAWASRVRPGADVAPLIFEELPQVARLVDVGVVRCRAGLGDAQAQPRPLTLPRRLAGPRVPGREADDATRTGHPPDLAHEST